jgi:hypothetical protein
MNGLSLTQAGIWLIWCYLSALDLLDYYRVGFLWHGITSLKKTPA